MNDSSLSEASMVGMLKSRKAAEETKSNVEIHPHEPHEDRRQSQMDQMEQ